MKRLRQRLKSPRRKSRLSSRTRMSQIKRRSGSLAGNGFCRLPIVCFYHNESMNYDLILRNGHVIDPSRNIDGVMDIGIADGRIAAVEEKLAAPVGVPERDVTGRYVCPGLIALPGHCYDGSFFGIAADTCLNHGVTTGVVAGT